MDPESYKLAWSIYIGAGVVFSLISAWVLFRYLWRELAYLLMCLLLVLMFVPAPVTANDPSVLAPALIVFTLDTLTIDPTATAGIEALTRLVVGMAGAVVAAIVLSVLHRLLFRRAPAPAVVTAEAPETLAPAQPVSPPHPARRKPPVAGATRRRPVQ